jgi:hypothetical protein
MFGKFFKGSEQMCSGVFRLPVDFQALTVEVLREVIGVATTLWPRPSPEPIRLLSESEEAGLNEDRLVLVRKLLDEVKSDTKCPSCLEHVNKAQEEVTLLEKQMPTIERVARLRENLQKLLEEAKSELPISEEAMGSVIVPSKELTPTLALEKTVGVATLSRPESGRTYAGQTTEAYCAECIEGHTMKSLTEMRHAIDRYRTSGEMSEGVLEKTRVAIGELLGIDEDVKDPKNVSPEIKEDLNRILDKARWIRKEYGVGGKGVTAGMGGLKELEELRNEIGSLQIASYALVKKCPTCLRKIA